MLCAPFVKGRGNAPGARVMEHVFLPMVLKQLRVSRVFAAHILAIWQMISPAMGNVPLARARAPIPLEEC